MTILGLSAVSLPSDCILHSFAANGILLFILFCVLICSYLVKTNLNLE